MWDRTLRFLGSITSRFAVQSVDDAVPGRGNGRLGGAGGLRGAVNRERIGHHTARIFRRERRKDRSNMWKSLDIEWPRERALPFAEDDVVLRAHST
jgi:hypothetical protein